MSYPLERVIQAGRPKAAGPTSAPAALAPQPGDAMAARAASSNCRSCGRRGLTPILDLGAMPLSDGFLPPSALADPPPPWPLELTVCADCSLVQILETVAPEKLFCEDYPYFSSFSDSWLAHSRQSALDLIAERGLNGESLVVELASNDGYMLRNFVEQGIPVLGIDPAEGPARVAESLGVPTLCTFFTRELADDLRAQGKRADLVLANNVLAHVPDTNGFVAGIARLLADDGLGVIECPYVVDLIEKREFDTIYHEHLCYFSVTALEALFSRHGLHLVRVERLKSHGGSLRLFVSLRSSEGSGERSGVEALLAEERRLGVDRPEYYAGFADAVCALRDELTALVRGLKAQGKRIAAYGAAAKGTILLNAVGLGADVIDFAVDRNVHKQGKFIPGVHVPIDAPARILQDMPDYVLLLPWNLRDEILQQQEAYRRRGGKFIIPLPRPQVV